MRSSSCCWLPFCVDLNTPIASKMMPLISKSSPSGFSSAANNWSRTRWPITATLRRCCWSMSLNERPWMIFSELMFSMPANPPWMLKAPLRDLRTVYGGTPPQIPTEFCPVMNPTLGTLRAMAWTSSGLSPMSRPIGIPSYGICVVPFDQTQTVLVLRGNPSATPISSPLPMPNSTVSMKMPQKTPKAVSAVRSLCRLSVLKISCHFSMSIMAVPSLRLHRFGGCDLRGAQRRHEPGEHADADQQHDGGDRQPEVDFGIQEVRQLGARAAQRE